MLINDAMQAPETPAPDAAPEQAAPQDKQGANPADIHKKLGMSAMQIIYDKKASASLVQMMKAGANDPASAVAQAALVVLDRLKKSVQSVNPKAAYAVAPLIVMLLLEMAEAAKLFKADMGTVSAALKALGGLTQYEDQAQQAAQSGGQPVAQPGVQPGAQPTQPDAQPVMPAPATVQ